MPATLPVPVEFRLPNAAWRPVRPEDLGVQNAAFLAVREEPAGDYTPTISMSGDFREDGATLDEIADESVRLLEQQAADVELVKRNDIGSEEAPGVTQLLGATVEMDGRRYDLQQAQVLLGLVDEEQPNRRLVLILTLTATNRQIQGLMPEFQDFVGSVRAAPGADGGE